jgi:hypothetical protein
LDDADAIVNPEYLTASGIRASDITRVAQDTALLPNSNAGKSLMLKRTPSAAGRLGRRSVMACGSPFVVLAVLLVIAAASK